MSVVAPTGIYREHMRNSGKEDKHKTNNLVSSFLNMSCNNLANVLLICKVCVPRPPTIYKSAVTYWNNYNLYILVRKVDNEHIYALRYFIANLGTYGMKLEDGLRGNVPHRDGE